MANKRSAPEVTETEIDPESEVEAEIEPEPETVPEAETEVESAPEDGDTLYARATELKIKGRSKMKRAELAEAVSLAEAQLAAEAAFSEDELPAPPVGAGAAAPPGHESPDAEPPKVATPEQVNKIAAARTDQLEVAVQDPELPPHLREVVALELSKRTETARQAAQQVFLQTPLERYKVTKGGRFVTAEGFITELPEGSLVTPLTHDVKALRAQGIEWAPATVVSVGLDELGKQISEVR